MTWDDLPHELEEKIVSYLSLVELKDLHSIRKVFLAVFRKQLAVEQKALYDIAIARYGSTRIKVFADLCISLLTTGTVGEDLAMRMKQVPRPPLHLARRYQGSTHAFIFIHSYDEGVVQKRFFLGYLKGLADLGWVAFLQAILSVGLSALSYRVQIICFSPSFSDPLTLAGVRAHITPLLPLVTGFTFTGWGQEITVEGGVHAGKLGPAENKGIALQLVFQS